MKNVTKYIFGSKSSKLSKPYGWEASYTPPDDPIMSIGYMYQAEKDPRKINVAVGAYRDENGSPYVLPTVKTAISKLYRSDYNLEYSPMGGCPEMTYLALREVLGDDS